MLKKEWKQYQGEIHARNEEHDQNDVCDKSDRLALGPKKPSKEKLQKSGGFHRNPSDELDDRKRGGSFISSITLYACQKAIAATNGTRAPKS
jgi:hypothetical protein